ncbi:MAG: hypothetical protein ABFD84_14440 [Candidatus Polarisedimenticolia bacterium]|nr:hypothetical protein [bacterium]
MRTSLRRAVAALAVLALLTLQGWAAPHCAASSATGRSAARAGRRTIACRCCGAAPRGACRADGGRAERGARHVDPARAERGAGDCRCDAGPRRSDPSSPAERDEAAAVSAPDVPLAAIPAAACPRAESRLEAAGADREPGGDSCSRYLSLCTFRR